MSFTPVTLLLGIVLIIGALALFFLDRIRPGYARESDKVYGVIMLIAGLLSLGHLTAGVTESFQLMLMTGMLMTITIENVRKREPIIEPPMGRSDYPPRPRYNERPPARRVYRAELDDRDRQPRDAFDDRYGQRRPQRMAPGPDYWPDDLNEQRKAARQPYEEYGAPAGRLQPSPGSDRRPIARAQTGSAYPEERYGQRPPASPSSGPSPAVYPPPSQGGFDNGSMNRPVEDRSATGMSATDRPAIDRPATDRDSGRPGIGPNMYDSQDSRSQGYSRGEESSMGADRSSRGNRERPANSDRMLDVKPYSEAPKLDIPEAPYS